MRREKEGKVTLCVRRENRREENEHKGSVYTSKVERMEKQELSMHIPFHHHSPVVLESQTSYHQ